MGRDVLTFGRIRSYFVKKGPDREAVLMLRLVSWFLNYWQ